MPPKKTTGTGKEKKTRTKRQAFPSLLADTPLADPKLDRLGRSGFARALADSILQLKGRDSIVIGLSGRWGSGKSSVLNFLVTELEKGRKKHKPLVLHFNPWWFSGQDRLLQAFLQQLGAAVNRAEKDKPLKKASGLLGKLSTVLRPAALIPVVGEYFKMAQEAAASASEVTKQYAEALAADLEQVRKEIDELLGDLPHRIVIIMDDIDRLSANEIAQLFSILKAVADFTNTVYVLAYDERVVRKAIQSTLGVNGKTYLEKIVQLHIDLPAPDKTTLQQLFLEQLQELLEDHDASQIRGSTDFWNVFHDGLKHFLVTPRACKRLMNVLRFTYPPLRGEVYWPDLVGVGGLTAFAPQAVRVITSHPESFIGHSDYQDDRKTAEKFHRAWLGQIEEKNRQAVEGMVRRLLPKVDAALGGSTYGGDWEARWRAQLRVRSEVHFEKYFRLCVPSGALSEAEWHGVLALLEDRRAFTARILELCRQTGRQGFVSQGKEVLDRLKDFVKLQATPAQARKVFEAVMEAGDEIAETEDKVMASIVPVTNALRIWWLLPEALGKLQHPPDRVQLVQDTLQGDVGLHTAAELVKLLGYENGMYSSSREGRSSPEPPLIPKAKVEELATAVGQKIEASAADGSLAAHPSFMSIVWHWQLFGQGEKATAWVRQLAQSDKELVRIIQQMKGEIQVQSFSDRVATATPHVDCKNLADFIPPLEARQRCNTLLTAAPDWLTPDDCKTLQVVVASIGEDGSIHDPRPGRRAEKREQGVEAGQQVGADEGE